jgi:hypothetical protein
MTHSAGQLYHNSDPYAYGWAIFIEPLKNTLLPSHYTINPSKSNSILYISGTIISLYYWKYINWLIVYRSPYSNRSTRIFWLYWIYYLHSQPLDDLALAEGQLQNSGCLRRVITPTLGGAGVIFMGITTIYILI